MQDQTPPIRFGYKCTQVIVSSVFKLFFGLKVIGKQNVPRNGAFILASNHQSWFDPPIVGGTCPREINFAAKKELFDSALLGKFVRYHNCIPIKRSGYDRAALEALKARIANNQGTIIFPEGTRYLDGKLRPPKAGVGMLALWTKAPIIPVYVDGSAYIGRQFWKRRLKVTFGKPFTLEDIGMINAKGKDAYRGISVQVMHRIAEVGGVKPPEIDN